MDELDPDDDGQDVEEEVHLDVHCLVGVLDEEVFLSG